MKKKLYGFFSILTLFAVCVICFPEQDPATVSLNAVASQFAKGMDQMESRIIDFEQITEQFKAKKATEADLQKAHLATRLAFKEIEYILEYLDSEGVKSWINGAPLPKPEQAVPELRILYPKGLQTLDELVFSDEVSASIDSITYQVKLLKKSYSRIKSQRERSFLQHRFVFEAVRFELIRVFTLGVTGFDTPGSANAIPEAIVAMGAIQKAMAAYYPVLKVKNEPLVKQLDNSFTSAIQYLEDNNDFDTFNRLAFLKSYINPLFKAVLEAQELLGVENAFEAQNTTFEFNYEAENIFANNILDPNYFASIKKNELTDKRIELGHILFFDPILSGSNQGACASCHNPDKAFTDGTKKTPAMNGDGTILRNTPTVVNSIFAKKYFYDLREHDLGRQIKHVVFDPKEFATDFAEIESKLSQSEEYKRLFEEAYPNKGKFQLSRYSISDALASYVATLYSFNSPFDQYVRGEVEKIDPAVERGFNVFMGKGACGTCHFAPTFNGLVPPLFNDSESEVLGVPVNKDTLNPVLDPDLGRIANRKNLDGAYFYANSFKTVTVRNIALTAPYMHNGVYDTLEEVIDFYNRGGGAGMGMDLPHQTLPDSPLNLSKQEIADLVVFMEALTDTTGLTRVPASLPKFENKPEWNKRTIGGDY